MVPIMAIAISPVRAAGITLPILVFSDVVALISYRRIYDWTTLKVMVPGALFGLGVGWLTAAWVTEAHIRLIVGLISILFALQYFFGAGRDAAPYAQEPVKGSLWAAVAGFTSFVSHAGGPPFQVYVAPLKLEPLVFAGTSVIFFALLNTIKLVPYFFLGQFDTENLATAAILLPISIPATLLGVWLVKRFDPRSFYTWIYATILLVGVYLTAESVVALV
jgi:uncharacterized membrane protein YfcA